MRTIDVMVHDVVTDHPDSDGGGSNRGPISGAATSRVSDGVVHLWGLVGSEAERKALLTLAESVPGVSRVADEMTPAY